MSLSGWHRRCAVAVWMALGLLVAAQAAEPPQPFVFVHTSDPELGKPDLKGTSERFAQLAQRANQIGAAFVIVSGDLTRNCTTEQLKAFDDILKQFKMPVRLLPGNHDEPEVYEKHFGKDHYVFTHGNCDFICLNSNLLLTPSDKTKEQWTWLEAALKEARRQNRAHIFVVMHHPLAGLAKMNDLLVKYGVEAVLCGHEHTTQELPEKGYTVYVTPGTCKFRDKNGLGYRVFRVSKERIQQEFVPLEKDLADVELLRVAAERR